MVNNHNQSSIVTLGVFDGLHRGHMSILDFMKETNYQQKIVLVFHPHPQKIIKGINVKYITPIGTRLAMFKQLGFENVIVLEFNKELSQISGEEFVKNFLIMKYNCKHFVVGFNAHFGKGRDVTPDLLPDIARTYNIKVTICKGVNYEGAPISSTRIRQSIKEGALYDTMQMLGRPFFIEGNIVKGISLGRKIGFPTLNVQYDSEQLLPPEGVYFGYIRYNTNKKPAMINLGLKTFMKEEVSTPILEAHIVNENIIDTIEKVQIEFIEKIRNEQKFNSVEELKQQLEKDKKYVIQKFSI